MAQREFREIKSILLQVFIFLFKVRLFGHVCREGGEEYLFGKMLITEHYPEQTLQEKFMLIRPNISKYI